MHPPVERGHAQRQGAGSAQPGGTGQVANGKATKIIIPSELQNLGGVVPSIKELLTDPKED